VFCDSVAYFSDTSMCMCACTCVHVCVFDVSQLLKNTKLKHISDCCTQAQNMEDEKVEMLLDILKRRDDELLPKFCDVLDESEQQHVARLIRKNVRQQQQQQQQPSKHTHTHAHTHLYHHLLTYCHFRSSTGIKNEHSLTIITSPLRAIRILCSY